MFVVQLITRLHQISADFKIGKSANNPLSLYAESVCTCNHKGQHLRMRQADNRQITFIRKS